jgi:hypothetical protein
VASPRPLVLALAAHHRQPGRQYVVTDQAWETVTTLLALTRQTPGLGRSLFTGTHRDYVGLVLGGDVLGAKRNDPGCTEVQVVHGNRHEASRRAGFSG